ncbi:MAG: UbiA family prenyltransferase, partial [Deltaproteobacteria bacterium]|nr:UbiA family prenyltransferase [Deltaproteobacteria bacterium]
ILGELRPHQWAKNALLFAQLLLAHQLAAPGRLRAVIVAFVSFCAIASAGYVVNDLVDVDADRRHPTKRLRPIATGALPMPIALALIAGLLASGFAMSLSFVSLAATGMLAAYLALTLCYSFYFKRQLLLDVLVLAGLYTHRVLTGGVAAEVPVSPWLLAFSTFFFLSLALVKRYVELLEARELEREHIERRAYQVADLGLVETMGLSCGYIAVLVLCLFVSSDDVSRLYSAPVLLWLMCPVMLYWISRIWFLARRGELHDDPVLFATRDRISFVCGVLVLAVVLAATVL